MAREGEGQYGIENHPSGTWVIGRLLAVAGPTWQSFSNGEAARRAITIEFVNKRWGWIIAGVVCGLQNRCGVASAVLGGFDSHASPNLPLLLLTNRMSASFYFAFTSKALQR